MKELVLEALYADNKFFLDYDWRADQKASSPITAIHLPPQNVQRLVRRLHLSLGSIDIYAMELLKKALKPLRNLTNLEALEISVEA